MLSNNKKGFSIVLAIGMSLIFTLIALFVMEYIVPFARSTSGIENATIAQYQSFGAIEESLRQISQHEPGHSSPPVPIAGDRGSRFEITGSGTLVPSSGAGNGLDSDWNRLSQTEPIQLLVGNNRINSISLDIRVPEFGGQVQSLESSFNTGALVLWQLSSENSTLTASSEDLGSNGIIRYAEIEQDSVTRNIDLWGRMGNPIDDFSNSESFSYFYGSECGDTQECVLRISLINRLPAGSDREYPFLEYQIQTSHSIPFQITQIESRGISFGFSRDYNVRVPQATTSAAFDFTVFQ